MNKIIYALDQHQNLQRDRKYQTRIVTRARVGQGHASGHTLTSDWLSLQADFASAKDAVAERLNIELMQKVCQRLNMSHVTIQSQVTNNMEFLLRPDLGRCLSASCAQNIDNPLHKNKDVVLLISGGLSARAIEQQVPLFLPAFMEQLSNHQLTFAPVMINQFGRVALGDDVNEITRARMTIVLIGERPGLGTSDSMGIYFTYNARKGCTDESRNCVSNIHQHGLSPEDAALKLSYLIRKSLALGLSGVGLKDDQSENLTLL